MNLDELQKKLFAAARTLPPSDHVPYAFEKRIMARLASRPALDVWMLWSRLLWRAAAPCVAIMVAASIWTLVSTDPKASPETLAADLESTVLAPLTHLEESW